jgi:hypothetical protein
MDPIAEQGWYWAHNMIRPMWTEKVAHADAAACAILVAYRAGLREGMSRKGSVPEEIPYSDFDLTTQMFRFDESMKHMYNWPVSERVAP